MSLTLIIVSHNRRGLGAKASMSFGQDGGTIGRSLENDWPLPDKKKFLSGRHASIDYRSGSYYIIDTSKNGVFINGEHTPVGHGKPQRLFPGDKIRIGEYEMSVAIENVDDTQESLAGSSHIDPVDIRQRVEAPDPTSYELLAAEALASTGVDIKLEDDSRERVKVITGARAAPELSLAPETKAPAPVLTASFRGAGIDPSKLTANQATQLLHRIGEIMRVCVAGLIDNLQLQAVQKAQVGQPPLNQTANLNPLALSGNVDEALRYLLGDHGNAQPGPVASVSQAFSGLRTHQRVMHAASRRALHEYLMRLDPDIIERSVSNGKTGTLRNAANKFRYWDTYKDIYSVLANRPSDEWPQAYRDAIAQAYAQLTAPAVDEPTDSRQREAG